MNKQALYSLLGHSNMQDEVHNVSEAVFNACMKSKCDQKCDDCYLDKINDIILDYLFKLLDEAEKTKSSVDDIRELSDDKNKVINKLCEELSKAAGENAALKDVIRIKEIRGKGDSNENCGEEKSVQ